MLRMTVFYFMVEAQDKQKNGRLGIMDEAWIRFLVDLFYSKCVFFFLFLFFFLVSPAKLLESLDVVIYSH